MAAYIEFKHRSLPGKLDKGFKWQVVTFVLTGIGRVDDALPIDREICRYRGHAVLDGGGQVAHAPYQRSRAQEHTREQAGKGTLYPDRSDPGQTGAWGSPSITASMR